MSVLAQYFRNSPYTFWSFIAASCYVFLGTLVFLRTYFFYDSDSVWYFLGQWCSGKFMLESLLYYSYFFGFQLFMRWNEVGFILGQTLSFLSFWGLFYGAIYVVARYVIPELQRLYIEYFGTV
ncbi:MAG: hypothetical protein EAZ57_08180 [Cytophagales bacterium]|nr:MAG: hypothetical protein EAZ67_09255 [Cytophagales bacterium]TAF60310.1 MAG: hypothetical protein EAZ57_08180 [Cytophagales bacterium]